MSILSCAHPALLLKVARGERTSLRICSVIRNDRVRDKVNRILVASTTLSRTVPMNDNLLLLRLFLGWLWRRILLLKSQGHLWRLIAFVLTAVVFTLGRHQLRVLVKVDYLALGRPVVSRESVLPILDFIIWYCKRDTQTILLIFTLRSNIVSHWEEFVGCVGQIWRLRPGQRLSTIFLFTSFFELGNCSRFNGWVPRICLDFMTSGSHQKRSWFSTFFVGDVGSTSFDPRPTPITLLQKT